jgi:RNA polymerase sigma factor (sigma-70 family)
MSLPPFEQVVSDHGEAVLRVCAAVAGAREAEEVWSETFLAALAAYPRLRPDSNVRAWLLAIARNKAIDLHRASARRPLALEQPREQADEPARDRVPDPMLAAALAALTPRQRCAVLYRYVAELSYSRVAELLETSEAAARRSASDGIAALRKRLGEEVPR